jgi:hypothetical protein
MRQHGMLFAAIPVLFLASCFKEDEKVTPHDPGDVRTAVIEMKKDYRYQVYFDLKTGTVVSSNLKKEWDLGFECSPGGWHIILNTSSFMLAANTGMTDFGTAIDTTGLEWKYDKSDGDLDSTAVGEWISFTGPDSVHAYTNQVYVIDRGYDELGNLRGLRQVSFDSLENGHYGFRFANLDGSGQQSFRIAKDPALNFIYFSFDDDGKVQRFEPPKESWDVLFTQYTTLLFTDEGDPYPYLVTGVYTNRYNVFAGSDTLMDFSLIDLELAEAITLTTAQDEIGYDWKDVTGDVETGNVSYVIIPGLNYIILDHEGFLYKLRFISFYNDLGEKGYPTFEFQLL